ncbi:MAG: hypothetical protein ABR595_06630 [Psychroflexus sp.]
METKRLIKFKMLLVLIFVSNLVLAQSTKTYKESFDVDSDVLVKIDLSHTKIKIDTWNKNKVEVKTILKTKNDSEQDLDALFDAWKISALGNSERVEVKDHRSGENVMVFSNVQGPQRPPRPPRPPRPTKPNQPPKPSIIDFDFDYEAFKEDGKAYIEKFKKQLDSSDFKENILSWQEDFAEAYNAESVDSIRAHSKVVREQMKIFRENMKSFREHMKLFRDDIKSELKLNNDTDGVERVIEIKMPKSAKLEVNLKHSELDITSVEHIDANLNYSGLQIDDISGEFSKIYLRYSNMNLNTANQLDLKMDYAKDVKLTSVKQLDVDSKMSELSIGTLEEQAIINGSYGKLEIKNIKDDFKLLDIKLSNSDLKMNLPQSKFQFYAKTSGTQLDLSDNFEVTMRKSFEHKIYQNSNHQNSNRLVNITADYSNINLN